MTNAAGVHADALAESVLGAILFHAKRIATRLENQQVVSWAPLHCLELRDRTVCVIGTGCIGQACACRAAAFGRSVIGVRRIAGPVVRTLTDATPPTDLHGIAVLFAHKARVLYQCTNWCFDVLCHAAFRRSTSTRW
jgi:phosphoglycerate dehydrogenase-like enzyme